MYNFDDVDLSISEKYKLFIMRFKKHVSEEFLGDDVTYLIEVEFVTPDLKESNSSYTPFTFSGTYSLTNKYMRYRIHKRKKFIHGIFNSFLTPIVVSIVTSILTVLILRSLGLK